MADQNPIGIKKPEFDTDRQIPAFLSFLLPAQTAPQQTPVR